MPTTDPVNCRSSEARRALSQSTIRAAELLHLNQAALAQILGVSVASVIRMHEHEWALEPETKPWNHAVLFIRLFRTLQTLVGERDDIARAWLHTLNRDLGDVPAKMIRRTEGLGLVVQYVNAASGRN